MLLAGHLNEGRTDKENEGAKYTLNFTSSYFFTSVITSTARAGMKLRVPLYRARENAYLNQMRMVCKGCSITHGEIYEN